MRSYLLSKRLILFQIGIIMSILICYIIFNIPQKEIKITFPKLRTELPTEYIPFRTYHEEPIRARYQRVEIRDYWDFKVYPINFEEPIHSDDGKRLKSIEPHFSHKFNNAPLLLPERVISVTIAETSPSFLNERRYKRSITKFEAFIREQVKDFINVTGTVKIAFTINKEGAVTNVEILSSTNNQLSNEVIRAANSSPIWKVATSNGDAISVRCNASIRFR